MNAFSFWQIEINFLLGFSSFSDSLLNLSFRQRNMRIPCVYSSLICRFLHHWHNGSAIENSVWISLQIFFFFVSLPGSFTYIFFISSKPMNMNNVPLMNFSHGMFLLKKNEEMNVWKKAFHSFHI